MDYYAYRLMKRPDESDHLFRSGHLMSQYLVDAGAKIDNNRLLWVKKNQQQLRIESYAHLRDAVLHDGENPANVGTATILPSTFVGSPRYMNERAQVLKRD